MPRGIYNGKHGPAKMENKPCFGCGCIKRRSEFYQRTNGQVVSRCKECCRIAARARSADETKPIKQKHRAKHADKIAAYRREYASKLESRFRRRELLNNRKRNDPAFAIECVLRVRLADKVRKVSAGKAAGTMELLGCSIEGLLRHLENQWRPGMSWVNWGRGRGKWHIDHRKPIAAFDLRDPEAQRECFHYANLQPLWQDENLRKGARFNEGMCGV